MKKILISGATGLIGRKIVDRYNELGYEVNFLSTNKSKLDGIDGANGFLWNPAKNEIDIKCLEGVSAVINLAGSPIAKRWTKKKRYNIYSSRVNAINILAKALRENEHEVEQFITASAIGYYPFSETAFYDEDYTSKSDHFLVDVVRTWESAANQIQEQNIKVAKVRIGIVLSERGGALAKLVEPVKYFIGSSLGSGKQWQSWIHIDDIANLFVFVEQNKLSGVFNGVSPNPVSFKVLINQIGKVIKRPIFLPPVPEFVLRLILGEMHVIVTRGQRVSSKKIESLGFKFKYFQLESALEDLLA